MSVPFVRRETLRWVDLDSQGVVNNAIYLTWFEQARLGYFEGLLHGDRFPFLLGSTSLRFERPGKLGMEPEIEARVTRLGGKSFDMAYLVRSKGEVFVRGDATLIWVDEEMRPTRIPDVVRSEIAAREGIAAEEPRRA